MRKLVIIPALLFVTDIAAQEPPDAPGAPEATDVNEEAVIDTGSGDPSLTLEDLELTPEIVAKLDAEQLQSLLQEKELTKRQRNEIRGSDLGPEIVAPVGTFICIIVIVFLPLFFRWRREQVLHQTLRAMVEKGAEIPVELITPQKPKRSDLRRGLVLVGLGLGVSIFLAVLPEIHPGLWASGLIPILIGAGYLVVWRLQPNGDPADSHQG